MTHAFFKALLFLSAGAVIVATHHEQNIFKMGPAQIAAAGLCLLPGGGFGPGRAATGDRRFLQ